ncbi:PaaI family thioesterase [Corynebacterium sp. 320]|uniref:PaaI family thioesterase n=1 Tax=Corynebacterium TaxID=1716 RepID=UPI00125CAD6C|nr:MULTISPECIES: PaaI family thioesterase [Corynebacterium]KAB1504464.1 PaaI family thioesterase [Corynebacterium sp. 320]KAB1552438.1 PaaI family thioesterase [Corynebacterium sp. 321]KAB1554348.1 PaaI family thioesterase [Corynebacterium sp. 319]KAB3528600.1 PaaI family thioesterase [Corynebacterium sp. 250]KAB3539909.1 PaaI family thioesterase [Corynebacterium sp. 366]
MHSNIDLQNLLDKSVKDGFDAKLNLTYVHVDADRVHVSLDVDASLHQPAGIVHGGVFASIVESVASAGGAAYLFARSRRAVFVGMSNNTEFLKSVSGGVLEAIGTPLHQGTMTQLWKVEIKQAGTGELVSVGTLRGQNVLTGKGA